MKARGEELVAQALALQERIAKNFWELGRLLATMRDEGIHGALGFPSLEGLVAARLGLKRSQAWKLMTVAERLPRAEAVALGVEKAYALIAYTEATPEEDRPADVAKSDAKVGGRVLSKATVKDVQAATHAARPKRPPTLAERREAKADEAMLQRVRQHLGAVGVPKAAVSLSGDQVRVLLSRRQVARMLRD